MRRRIALLFLTALGLGACGDDDPTSIGGELLPDGMIRTLEVVLEAPEFLVADTAFSGYVQPSEADFQIVAEDFAGVLDAHALYRFASAPQSVSFTVNDTVRTDTLPTFVGASMVMRIDTLRTLADGPAVLALYRVAQAWDPATATWTLAVDSGTVATPWTEPGGTRGVLVDTAVWTPGIDSVVFAVDSATVAAWSDTTDAARGALVLSQTTGVRIRARHSVLRLDARPSIRPDTTVVATVGVRGSTFVFDPPPPPPDGVLRVDGVPTWRSFLRFDPDLRDLRVGDCADPDSLACVRIGDATITRASLLLQPLAVPPAFVPADSVDVVARPALESPLFPLSRSPLAGTASGQLARPVPPSAFALGAAAARVELPVTPFVISLAAEPGTVAPSNLLALHGSPEGGQFGFGEFGALESGAAAPRLRLVLTIASDEGIR